MAGPDIAKTFTLLAHSTSTPETGGLTDLVSGVRPGHRPVVRSQETDEWAIHWPQSTLEYPGARRQRPDGKYSDDYLLDPTSEASGVLLNL